ncbi:MAG: hypothetical protein AUI14_11710 [Actinobacteria bacterium 13_2_20CM_2_71_6]|nr:MAG: hypothetical protein AUI14_11710 [Actinobacteria bacterium 13_2_20CM_2_71_6]
MGVGDSSLILAGEPTTHTTRSMLVDGGLGEAASTVHNKVRSLVTALDVILVSHFDTDHSVGVANLLLADNLWHLCDLIAGVAVIGTGGIRQKTIAGVTAAAYAAASGAWGADVGGAGGPALAARTRVDATYTDGNAAAEGIEIAKQFDYKGALLVPPPVVRSRAARSTGVAAANAIEANSTADQQRAEIRWALFLALKGSLPAGARFDTGGIYRDTRIIDIGTVVAPAQNYLLAIQDKVRLGSSTVQVPGVNRPILSLPPLGSEVLWNGPVPANAPVAIVVSTPSASSPSPTGTGWRGQGVAPVTFNSGQAANDVSIGVVLVFGGFTYFTAGDLPSQGEDPIGQALVSRRLPDGRGGLRPKPLPDLVGLKCSHHGSDASTSDAFVGEVQPAVAVLSCGNMHDFPTQRVVGTLHRAASVERFYLTNCQYVRAYVPASAPPVAGVNQLMTPGNRSRVAGDNNPMNRAIGRHRGDIRLFTTREWAYAAASVKFTVSYWENTTQQMMVDEIELDN